MEQMITTLSLRSRITSSSNSPQPSTDSSTSTWLIGLAASPSETTCASSVSVLATPPAVSAQREGGPDDRGQRDVAVGETRLRIGDRGDDLRPRHPQPGLLHRPAEGLSILGAVDRLVVGADQLDAEALQRAVVVQRLGEVESGLPAERRQQRVRALALDHPGDRAREQWLDVGPVGELRVGHDRRRVRVDQHDLVALLQQHLAGLHPGVVELGRLADHDRPRPDQEDLLDVVAPRHAGCSSAAR